MSHTIKTKYLGGLRCESVHLKSGNTLITDAPTDNKGKGAAFSPTDLLATALATCMITIMAIHANQQGLNIDGVECDVTKIMSSTLPRKVVEVVIDLHFPTNNFDQKQQQMLRDAAYSCPVAISVHEDLKKTVNFNF